MSINGVLLLFSGRVLLPFPAKLSSQWDNVSLHSVSFSVMHLGDVASGVGC